MATVSSAPAAPAPSSEHRESRKAPGRTLLSIWARRNHQRKFAAFAKAKASYFNTSRPSLTT